jgi:hypothetical protein
MELKCWELEMRTLIGVPVRVNTFETPGSTIY